MNLVKMPLTDIAIMVLCAQGSELWDMVLQEREQGTEREAVDATTVFLRHFETCPGCGYVEEAV